MAINIFDSLTENSLYIYILAIVATVLAIAISTKYAFRNLFNIRSVGEPSEKAKVGTKAWSCDAAAEDSGSDIINTKARESATEKGIL